MTNSTNLVNGQHCATVSVRDRGLAYGDGVFRTCLILESQVIDIERHIRHLMEACKRLGMRPPSQHRLTDEMMEVAQDRDYAILRVTLTRGISKRGYPTDDCGETNRILCCDNSEPRPLRLLKEGVAVGWCETPLGSNPRLAGIKTLNRLEQVLARSEWSDNAIYEGLMRDADGRVICGTMSNLFVIRDGILSTPSLTQCGIAGTMRERIIEHAEQSGIGCTIEDIHAAGVMNADELFLTNAVIGILPIQRLTSLGDPITHSTATSTKPVGPITTRLISDLDIVRRYQ